jgi:hypothetical protein
VTQEHWWLLEQQGLHRVADFLREAERDNLARVTGPSASGLPRGLAGLLRVLAGWIDPVEPTPEPGLAPVR